MSKSVIYSENCDFLPRNMELKKQQLKDVLKSEELVLRLVEKKHTYKKCRKVLFVAEKK